MQSDMLAEHSHRLLGMIIGILSLILLLWTWLREERDWVRRLARTLLLVVILQGVLGGARVRLMHLTPRRITICCAISQGSCLRRDDRARSVGCTHFGLLAPLDRTQRGLERTSTIDWHRGHRNDRVLQILIGAIMRADAALSSNSLWRSQTVSAAYWNFDVSIHFAHRVGALVVTALLLTFLTKLESTQRAGRCCGEFWPFWACFAYRFTSVH